MLNVISGKEIEAEILKIISKEAFDRSTENKVSEIVLNVKNRGDGAIFEYTKAFDNIEINEFSVTDQEFKDAYSNVGRDFIESLEVLGKNITEFHKKEKGSEWFEQQDEDAVVGIRNIPLGSAGIYVPGGRAKYPSSVLMNAIPAKVAGVPRVVMATPPPIDPHVLVAAAEVGVREVYKIGGAQAIAALAYGTRSVAKVDKIVGPGNIYVTIAKKLVSYDVGIDSLAGPSDILIIADCDAEPQYIAADLLSQCEHDPQSRAILVTDSETLIPRVLKEIESQFKKLKRQDIIKGSLDDNGRIFLVHKLKEAIDIANRIAPEHLEILVSPPQKIFEKITNAGAVFLGPYSPVAIGDYGAGPNHVLPTNGTARFSSPLGVYDFVKRQSFLGYTKGALNKIRKFSSKMAEVEGFDAHKRAIEIRFS
ncbi:histidinol dehydrogenase [Candidatus Saganbacteria bacterium]|nr:histidinol dehydrogenase [Candidatus Saganbacteria bacterium]